MAAAKSFAVLTGWAPRLAMTAEFLVTSTINIDIRES